MKGQGRRGQRSNLCFFLFVPLLLPGPWADLHQTWWEGGGRPQILAREVHFLKVKVIEVKGQICVFRGQRSNFCISAVFRFIWMKLGECIQVDP